MGLRWRAERAVGRCRPGRPLYHGRRAPLYTAAARAAAARRAPPHRGAHPRGAPRHPPPSPAPHTPPPRARYARGAVCALGPNRRFPPPRPHTAQRRFAPRCTPRRLVAATAGNTMAAPPPVQSRLYHAGTTPQHATGGGGARNPTSRRGATGAMVRATPRHATPRQATPRRQESPADCPAAVTASRSTRWATVASGSIDAARSEGQLDAQHVWDSWTSSPRSVGTPMHEETSRAAPL